MCLQKGHFASRLPRPFRSPFCSLLLPSSKLSASSFLLCSIALICPLPMAAGSLTTTASLFYPPRTPPGIHVMIVDSDCSYLTLVKKLLLVFRYQVKIFACADHAWRELQRRWCKVDIFLIDVQLPDFSGFELIDKIKNKRNNAPVIMCSSNEDQEALERVADQNGCFYMTKPASVEDLENLWKYVGWRRIDRGIDLDSNRDERINETSASQVEITSKNNKKKGKLEATVGKKKAQFLWTFPLQIRFFKAVNKLGLHKAIPTDIINMMKVPKLTRQNVASRLQKYRQFVNKVNEAISAYTKKYIPHMHEYFLEKFSPKEESESEEPSSSSKAKRSKRRKRRRLIDIKGDSSSSSILGESTHDSDITYSGLLNTEEDEFCTEVSNIDVSIPNIITGGSVVLPNNTGASLPNCTAGTSLHPSNDSVPSSNASFPINTGASFPISTGALFPISTGASFPSGGASLPIVDTTSFPSAGGSFPISGASFPNEGASLPMVETSLSFPSTAGGSFPMVETSLSFPSTTAGGSFPIVDTSLPLPCASFPNVGPPFPNVGPSFPNVGPSFPNVGASFPDVGPSFPNGGASVLPTLDTSFPTGRASFPISGAYSFPNASGVSLLNSGASELLPMDDTSFPCVGDSFPNADASHPMDDTSLPLSGVPFPNGGANSLPMDDTSFPNAGVSFPLSGLSFLNASTLLPNMVDTSVPLFGAPFPNGGTSLPNIAGALVLPFVDTSFPTAGSSCTVSGASVPMVDTSLPISGVSFPNAGALPCTGDTSLPISGVSFPNVGALPCTGDTSLTSIVDTSFPASGASFFIPCASFPNTADGSLPIGASFPINIADGSGSHPINIGASDQGNGYNTNVFDFGYNNNSERSIPCPNPYLTGSSIYNSNTPAGMMSSTPASSWLGENHSSLYCSGSSTEFQANHGGGFPSGVVSNNMPPFPVFGASDGNVTNMPAVPESYTLERSPAVLQPAENIPSGFAFEFDGGPYLIDEEEAAKLDAILKSGALFDF